jgi:hypothetical protein
MAVAQRAAKSLARLGLAGRQLGQPQCHGSGVECNRRRVGGRRVGRATQEQAQGRGAAQCSGARGPWPRARACRDFSAEPRKKPPPFWARGWTDNAGCGGAQPPRVDSELSNLTAEEQNERQVSVRNLSIGPTEQLRRDQPFPGASANATVRPFADLAGQRCRGGKGR